MTSPRQPFYVIRDPLNNRHFRGKVPQDIFYNVRLAGYGEPLPEEAVVTIHHFMGSRIPSDVVWGLSGVPVVSDRLWGFLVSKQIVGIKQYSVCVVDDRGIVYPDFHLLRVTSQRVAAIDWKQKAPLQRLAPYIEQYYKGGIIDVSTWDGSDVFCAGTWGFPLCTSRFHDIFLDNKIRNIAFIPLDEYEMSVRLADGLPRDQFE